MNLQIPFKISIKFPGDLEYIPSVRKFVSELLQGTSFSPKFAYRSEIIVDEICNNAVNFGCVAENAQIELALEVYDEHVDINIKDQGGSKDDLQRLRQAMKVEVEHVDTNKKGLGLEIVKMLSEKLVLEIDTKNLTSIHIVRKREDAEKQVEK